MEHICTCHCNASSLPTAATSHLSNNPSADITSAYVGSGAGAMRAFRVCGSGQCGAQQGAAAQVAHGIAAGTRSRSRGASARPRPGPHAWLRTGVQQWTGFHATADHRDGGRAACKVVPSAPRPRWQVSLPLPVDVLLPANSVPTSSQCCKPALRMQTQAVP